MSKVFKLLLVGFILALAVVPAMAQEEEGGIIVDSTLGSGAATLNPLLCTDTSCSRLNGFMFPTLVGVDPETALIQPGAAGGLADSWEISEDNTVYTFTLNPNYTWSDGTPVTANDFEFTWDAIASGEVETNQVFLTDTIVDMEALDDYTLQVTFASPDCEALNSAGIQPLPAHLYEEGGFAAINDQQWFDPEDVVIGPYSVAEHLADQQTALVPLEGVENTPFGPTANEGYIQKVVGDQTVQIEQLLAGEISVLDNVDVTRRSDVRNAENLEYYEFSPGNAYDYLALNYADPNNPQPALDEAGEAVEQGAHPIFGDVRVRQAIAHALDMDAIIEGAVFGEGTRMSSTYAQGSWPYNPDVPFYEYDLEAAAALLDEAGWVDTDNDPSTPRVCQGCETAEEGTELAFTLYTNQGNTRRTAIGTIVQDQLSQLGFAVDFQTIDFNVLLDIMDSQSYDAFILGWRNAYPFRADQSQLFSATSDVIAGDNFTSYINPEVDELMRQAAAVPGCDQAERAAIYGQIQEILAADLPYVPLFSINGFYAWGDNVSGPNPYPGAPFWNVQEWTVTN